MEDEINFVMIDKVEGTEQEQEEGMSETQRRQLTLEEVSNYNNYDFIYFIVFSRQDVAFLSSHLGKVYYKQWKIIRYN